MESQRKLLYRSIKETIDQEQWTIAQLLSSKEKNSQQYLSLKKELEALIASQWATTHIEAIREKITIIEKHQAELLLALQPEFHTIFEKVARESSWGIGYNEALRQTLRFNLIFGERELASSSGGSREQYRLHAASQEKEARWEKKLQKLAAARKAEKEKVVLAHGHKLLNRESYQKLRPSILTHIDNAVDTYKQKFLRDGDGIDLLQRLIDHYFLFILMQMFLESNVVIDSKRPTTNPFFLEFIEDCKQHIREKFGVNPTISSVTIKKKLFHTIDEKTKPLELLYKHAMDEDLIAREKYFNTYYFGSKKTSVDEIRRLVMQERKDGLVGMEKGWELLNPAYHAANDKKKRIIATLDLLTPQQSEDNQIYQVIEWLKRDLGKTEETMKVNVVFEEDPPIRKDPESLVKIRQQYLKRYQVPIQYRKIFWVVINRLNNLNQVKSNLQKKAKKSNEVEFDRLLNSDQSGEKILYHLKSIVTGSQIQSRFEEKRQQKQDERIQRIRWLCGADHQKDLWHNNDSLASQLTLNF